MISKRVVLKFPHRLVEKPIISDLVKRFNLEFNILKASVTPRQEGLMVLGLRGYDRDFQKGMAYLKKMGLTIEPLSQDVKRNDKKCIHCGACITSCPTGALYLNASTHEVIFDNSKCIACELCVPACPPRAMEVHF